MASTLFISDLHLEDARPETTGWLLDFLRGRARDADALYILGDLFEYWIGDDVQTDTSRAVAAALGELAGRGVPCHFQHGNRDFLIGDDYLRSAGLTVLPEEHVVDLYGIPTLLLHGDTLCTDDVAYQAFRRQVRDPAFQALFLGRTPQERLAMAQQARDASRQHTGSTSMGIMDANDDAVLEAFRRHGVARMVHGHTHRPAAHRHRLDDGVTGERFVLADWYDSGSCLEISAGGVQSIPLED